VLLRLRIGLRWTETFFWKTRLHEAWGKPPPFRHLISGDCHDASYTVGWTVVFG
jgi:hypothetical protein